MPQVNLHAPARSDGRPQYYDIDSASAVQCVVCLAGAKLAHYSRGQGFICDPANTPYEDGTAATICYGHLPDNAVIHDPYANETRTKDGTNTWRE